MSFSFLLCYSRGVVAVRKDKIMSKNVEQFFTVDLVCLLSMFFMFIYISVTKNMLDFVYLLFIILCYFRIKYYRWKKYH